MAHINLFLTELRFCLVTILTPGILNFRAREEDTTKTMYPVPLGKEAEREEKEGGGKVDKICDAMKKVLLELDENKYQTTPFFLSHCLLRSFPPRYLLSIITAHVKKSEPELETVLLRIRHLSQQEEGREVKKIEETEKENVGGSRKTGQEGGEETSREAGKVVVTSEEALKYILFLVDVDRLYDVALGMYDFQLVLMVAEKSQKVSLFP